MREPWEMRMHDTDQRLRERREADLRRREAILRTFEGAANRPVVLHRPKDLQEPGEDDYLLPTEDHVGEDTD